MSSACSVSPPVSAVMSLQLAACLLTLASLSAASAPDCSELVKPLILEDHSKMHGKWILHAASWDSPVLKNDLTTVRSSWIDMIPATDTAFMTLYWADRLDGDKCLQGLANVTVSDTSAHMTFNILGHTSYHEGKFYESCPDCMLSTDTTLLPDGEAKGKYIFLYTRTGNVEESQLETFKQQAACLNFLPEYIFPNGELCADDRVTSNDASNDEEEES